MSDEATLQRKARVARAVISRTWQECENEFSVLLPTFSNSELMFLIKTIKETAEECHLLSMQQRSTFVEFQEEQMELIQKKNQMQRRIEELEDEIQKLKMECVKSSFFLYDEYWERQGNEAQCMFHGEEEDLK